MMQNEPVVLCGLSEREAPSGGPGAWATTPGSRRAARTAGLFRENLLTFFNLVLFAWACPAAAGQSRDAFFHGRRLGS